MALDLGLDKVQEQLEKLTRLPRPYRIAMIPLSVLLIVGLYAYLFYMPARDLRRNLLGQEAQLQKQVGEVRAVVANLAAFEEEINSLERQFKQALRQLPDSKELPVLLTDISSIGKDAGLEMKAFRPKEEVQRTFYAEVPIEIEFTGEYGDIANFFARVARLPRIVNVSELEMNIEEQGPERTVLRVDGEATTFRFLESAPASATPTGVPGQQGGRS